ncbi:uncharacterized protein KY384_001926 [Bacidia gigantensis]|uniref:uncharacterized protein n=1 Tax=Bacidia gigantensis TaxID=2732470 RepID=UPI001D056CDF|nr:uncharacterized protein KY384_001926 [Bacidia gigantensis]KAG8533143.1 hypothetical protein KY384_001926 [Bacidia gigantensis]
MASGNGMSACCLSGKLHEGKPVGREEQLGGLSVYVSEPKGGSKAKSLIFITDGTHAVAVFGWETPNVRLLADEYAKAGFYVYVPDFLEGDSLDMSFLDNIAPSLKTQEGQGVTDKAANTAIVGTTLATWLPKHTEGKTKPMVDGFVNTLRTTPGTDKLGAVGFCWGARYAILEAHGQSTDENGSGIGGVDAVVGYHPSLVTVPGDFDPVKVPLSLAVGTKDSVLDNDTVGKIQDLLTKKADVPNEVRVYEDQVHGFALRGDWSSDKDKKAMDDSIQQGVEWLQKYLS